MADCGKDDTQAWLAGPGAPEVIRLQMQGYGYWRP